MKRLIISLLLIGSFAVASNSVDESAYFKELIHQAITGEMYKFVDALTFDELIGILELAKGKCILPYSSLDIKLQLFVLRLEKLPWWDELEDEDDTEVDYLFYELHEAAYQRAWELIEKMPNNDGYRAALMQQIPPQKYMELKRI